MVVIADRIAKLREEIRKEEKWESRAHWTQVHAALTGSSWKRDWVSFTAKQVRFDAVWTFSFDQDLNGAQPILRRGKAIQ